jgi:hypothetical protein
MEIPAFQSRESPFAGQKVLSRSNGNSSDFIFRIPGFCWNKSDANSSNLFIKIPEFAGNKVLTKSKEKSSDPVNLDPYFAGHKRALKQPWKIQRFSGPNKIHKIPVMLSSICFQKAIKDNIQIVENLWKQV